MKVEYKIYTSFCRIIFLLILLLSPATKTVMAQESNEYNIKAMFVLNFIKYVDLPNQEGQEEFSIGIVGESEIYDALVTLVMNRKENKRIRIYKVDEDSKVQPDILFIPQKKIKKTEGWAKKYQGKGVLIISDEGKSMENVSINLLTIKNKIRFEINFAQAREEGIKISTRLAPMAVNVQP